MTDPTTPVLIRRLASDLALAEGPPSFLHAVTRAAALAAGAALILCVALFGSGIHIDRLLVDPWFPVKVASMAVLGMGAAILLQDLARPDCGRLRFEALLPAAGLLLAAGIVDPSGFPLLGRGTLSVPTCLTAIVLLSLPGFALVLIALRTAAAVTRPRLAGAAAGLMAGAIGGAAYALACRNDGGTFIAVWYGMATVLLAALGTLVGRRALAW